MSFNWACNVWCIDHFYGSISLNPICRPIFSDLGSQSLSRLVVVLFWACPFERHVRWKICPMCVTAARGVCHLIISFITGCVCVCVCVYDDIFCPLAMLLRIYHCQECVLPRFFDASLELYCCFPSAWSPRRLFALWPTDVGFVRASIWWFEIFD